MPSESAERLSREFQQQILRIAQLMGRKLRTVALRADTEDIDSWWDQVSPQIQQEILTGQSALSQLARGYLVRYAQLEGVTLLPVVVEANAEQIATSLRVTGPVAFKTHMRDTGSIPGAVRAMATRLAGSGERLMLAGPRETTMATYNQRDQIAGWRRKPGGSPCPFCMMLISRGADYRSEKTASFDAHDNDRCVPQLLMRREREPAGVQELQNKFRDVTRGSTGKEAVAAWQSFVREQTAAGKTVLPASLL